MKQLEKYIYYRNKYIKFIEEDISTPYKKYTVYSKYNAVITGSDQVWNKWHTDEVFDKDYFLATVPSSVRRISYGVGVEKTFLVHSPNVEKVEVTRVGKARRAKLYYLRDRVGKAAKTKEMVGARIEDREITIKEDLVEEPVAEEVKEEVIETPVAEEVVETPVVEEVKAEAPVAEETTENKAE